MQLADRIEGAIDKVQTGALTVAAGGNLDFANLNQIMEVAKVVAISQSAIPKHLRDNVGACLAICIQASEWRMSPFAVANKSYVVNDRIAFEAQLVAAVILRRAPIVGRIAYTFTGDGPKRRCKTSAKLSEDGSVVEYESPEFDRIPVKNSPLWKSDPDQQLGYFSVRAMCRRHFPDVILGIYTPEEMQEAITIEAETIKPGRIGAGFSDPLTDATKAASAPKEPERTVEAPVHPEPAGEAADKLPDPDKLRAELIAKAKGANISKLMVIAYFGGPAEWYGLPASTLQDALDNWEETKVAIAERE